MGASPIIRNQFIMELLSIIWHLGESLMLAFHVFVWGRWVLRCARRPPKSITIPNSEPGPMSEAGLVGLFKEVYGDKILSMRPMEQKAAYRIINKDGTEDEIGYGDLVQFGRKNKKV